MSSASDKAVEAIMKRFLNSVITTSTWFVNYMERTHKLDAEDQEMIKTLRTKIQELREELEHYD